MVNWFAAGRTMHSQSGLIWTEAPLLTKLEVGDREERVYSKEGTAWTSCKMKKLWHLEVSVRHEGELTDARSRDPSAVSGNEDFVGWRGIEEVGDIVVDVLWRSCVDDEPEVGGNGSRNVEQGYGATRAGVEKSKSEALAKS